MLLLVAAAGLAMGVIAEKVAAPEISWGNALKNVVCEVVKGVRLPSQNQLYGNPVQLDVMLRQTILNEISSYSDLQLLWEINTGYFYRDNIPYLTVDFLLKDTSDVERVKMVIQEVFRKFIIGHYMEVDPDLTRISYSPNENRYYFELAFAWTEEEHRRLQTLMERERIYQEEKAALASKPIIDNLKDHEGHDKVFIGYDMALYRFHRQKIALYWDWKTVPMGLIAGPTGSGKSVELLLFLHSLKKMNTQIWIVDGKNSGDFLGITENYYNSDNWVEGVRLYKKKMTEVDEQAEMLNQNHVIVIDELATLLNDLKIQDKAAYNEMQKTISKILMTGRSKHFGLVVGLQRPDAEFFSQGSRLNFDLMMLLGDADDESFRMCFGSGKKIEGYDQVPSMKRGQGLVKIKGEPLRAVLIPKIDVDKVKNKLCENGKFQTTKRCRKEGTT